MAAMIWDEQAQAFKEAETPMKHDPTAGAWTDTTGLAYNPDADAWEEKWSATLESLIADHNGSATSSTGTASINFSNYEAYSFGNAYAWVSKTGKRLTGSFTQNSGVYTYTFSNTVKVLKKITFKIGSAKTGNVVGNVSFNVVDDSGVDSRIFILDYNNNEGFYEVDQSVNIQNIKKIYVTVNNTVNDGQSLGYVELFGKY